MCVFTRSLKSATLRVELNCQGRESRPQAVRTFMHIVQNHGEGGTNAGPFENLQLSTLVAISADHCASKCYFSGTFPRKIDTSSSTISAIPMKVKLNCI